MVLKVMVKIKPCLHMLSPFQRWVQFIFQRGCEKGKVMPVSKIHTHHSAGGLNKDERQKVTLQKSDT